MWANTCEPDQDRFCRACLLHIHCTDGWLFFLRLFLKIFLISDMRQAEMFGDG